MSKETVQEILEAVDELYLTESFREIHRLLEKAYQLEPNNVEVLWRLARSHFNLSEESPDKRSKEQALRKALEVALRGVELDPNHWAPHKWAAAIYGLLGDFLTTKEKIQNSWKIREHAQKAVDLKPDDGTSLHILGRWCYNVAGAGWLERKTAAALFATVPAATYEEALAFFEKAYEADLRRQTNSKRNAVYAAQTCMLLKRRESARDWYNRALSMPSNNVTDRKNDEDIRAALLKLQH